MSKVMNEYGQITCGKLMEQLSDLSDNFSDIIEGLSPLEMRAANQVITSNIGFKVASAILRIQIEDTRKQREAEEIAKDFIYQIK